MGSATVPVAIGRRHADRFGRVGNSLSGVNAGAVDAFGQRPKAVGGTPALPETSCMVPAKMRLSKLTFCSLTIFEQLG